MPECISLNGYIISFLKYMKMILESALASNQRGLKNDKWDFGETSLNFEYQEKWVICYII